MSTWIEYNFRNDELKGFADKLGWKKPLHITLVHFPRNIIEEQVETVRSILVQWYIFFQKEFVVIPRGNLSEFDSGAIVQEVYVPPRIEDQRLVLLSSLFNHGIRFSNNYDWNPHVTVGNVQEVKERKVSESVLYGSTKHFKIIGFTFHHSFGDPYFWRLKP